MGPTNVALVKLFQADLALREAQGRLDAVAKNVRIQERRVNDLTQKHQQSHAKLREVQTRSAQLDLEIKSRDAHIEKLRTQQQTAKNNKEYQTFLVEINTQKVDRGKIEEEGMKSLEAVDQAQQEMTTLGQQLESEKAKLGTMSAQIEQSVATLKAEVDSLRPARDSAAAAVPAKARDAFERLADRFEGEALAALARPDRRREEYLCTSCNMDLVADVYNKLHSRDELVFCPSCGRILFIPEDLPPDQAINKTTPKATIVGPMAEKSLRGKSEKPKVTRGSGASHKRASGELGKILTAAQGESVKAAAVLGMKPLECHVSIDGKQVGDYKCQNPGHLERIIRYRLQEAGILANQVDVVIREEVPPAADASAPTNGTPADAAPTAGSTPTGEPSQSTAPSATGDLPASQPSPDEPGPSTSAGEEAGQANS